MSNNLKNATAVFGGSFNPPTLAHLSVIEGASRIFGKVIVMPCKISPFKLDADVISGEDRIALISQMTAHLGNVTVSDYELSVEGVSFTYLTLTHLARTEKSMYFVLGTDNIAELDRWKNMDVINGLCTLYFVPRPGFEMTEADKDILARLGLRYEIAPFTGEEGSSTLLKAAVAFGKSREVVPECVANYVEENGLYGDYCYITRAYARYNMKPSRIEHVYRTVKSALILAKKNGVDAVKTVRAAMLHDIGKYVSVQQLAESGASLDSEALAAAKPIEHCYTGEYIAREQLGETDAEVLDAIRYHTTGKPGMSKLASVIFCADFIEDGRSFDGIEQIRALTYRDLRQGMKKILEHTLAYLDAKGVEKDAKTQACYEWIKSLGE